MEFGGPKRVIFEKPSEEMTKHIKPLYIKAHVNGRPVSRVLVDNGSALNVMPSRMLLTLGKSQEDLISTEVSVAAFTGEVTKTIRVSYVELNMGSKTSLSVFFVVNSSTSYQALLGRDSIHANWYVPSSLHQFLLLWKGDEVEVVWVEEKHFQANIDSTEALYYEEDLGPVQFLGKIKLGKPRSLTVSKQEASRNLQKFLQELYAIVPFRPK